MVLDWAFREAPRQKLALPLLETTLGAGTVRDTPTLTYLLTYFLQVCDSVPSQSYSS